MEGGAFAERLGVGVQTLRRLEAGSPSMSLGVAFEAALLSGVDLFSAPPDQLGALAREARDRVALLPDRVRSTPSEFDDDF